jgi:DNA-binding response OmpR family regulator
MPTALVIADSDWVVNDVHTALAVAQWDISALSDPRQAPDVVSETNPDVVIVDMQVGSMGGMAVIRAIRGAVATDRLPRTVLLLDRSADRFLARRALADASVLKPFQSGELRDAVTPLAVAVSTEEE